MSLKNSDKSSSEESFVIFSPNGRNKEKRRRRKTNGSKHSSRNEAKYRENKISKSLDKMLEKIKTINFKPRTSSGDSDLNEEYSKEVPINLTAADEDENKCSAGVHKTKSEGELYEKGGDINTIEKHHVEEKPVPISPIEPSKQSSETLDIPEEAVFIEKSNVTSASSIPSQPIGASPIPALKRRSEIKCNTLPGPVSDASQELEEAASAPVFGPIDVKGKRNEDVDKLSVTNNVRDNLKVTNQDTSSKIKSRKLLMEEALKFSGLPEPTDDHFRKIISNSLSDSLDNMNKSKKTKNKKLKDGKKSVELQVPETFSELSMALSRIFNRSSNRSRKIEFGKKKSLKKIKKLDMELFESNDKQKESASSMIINRFLRDVSENNESAQRDFMHDHSEREFDSRMECPGRSRRRSVSNEDLRSSIAEAYLGESFKNLQIRNAENQFAVQPRKDKSKLLQSLAVRNFSTIRSDRSRKCKSLPDKSSHFANFLFILPRLDRRNKSDREFNSFDLEKKLEIDS